MIKNDKQYNKIFKEYLNSKGIDTKNQKYCSCEDLGCDNCILKDVKNDSDFCARYPFKEIKNHEKQLSLLKKDIAIMAKWKKERKIEKNLKEICETFRTLIGNDNIDFTCYGISCDKCLFHNMDNFHEWARKMKEEDMEENG